MRQPQTTYEAMDMLKASLMLMLFNTPIYDLMEWIENKLNTRA